MGKKVVGNKVAFNMGKTDLKKGVAANWTQRNAHAKYFLSEIFEDVFLDPAHTRGIMPLLSQY